MRRPCGAIIVAWLGAAAAACSDGTTATILPSADGGAPDPTAAVFETDRVLEVEVELDPADWETLRHQGRDFTRFTEGCMDGPPTTIYDFFPATVTIDGEVVEEVGVRKKGFLGSLLVSRPSLKLSFDHYRPDQRYSGMERMTLNNNRQDPALVRQCLAYGRFAAAGLPASRCNFARVTVNGEYLGVYTHVEGVKKTFLRRYFVDVDGNLYEGQASDFSPEQVDTFEDKTTGQVSTRSDLVALMEALQVDDSQLLARLEPLVDLDSFLTFWALENLLGTWDGYTNNRNNFFVYGDPQTGKLHFIPWGPDMGFITEDRFHSEERPQAVSADAVLPLRLYGLPEVQDDYVARMRELLSTVWNEDELVAEVDRLETLLAPDVDTAGLEQIRDFIRGRRATLEAELAEGAPAWEIAYEVPQCLVTMGPVSGTFATTWGSHDLENPFEGTTAEISGLDGVGDKYLFMEGATAGSETDGSFWAPSVHVLGYRSDGLLFVVALLMEPALYEPGAEIDFHGFATFAPFGIIDMTNKEFIQLGYVVGGGITLDEAGTEPGDPVSGSFHGTLAVGGPAVDLVE